MSDSNFNRTLEALQQRLNALRGQTIEVPASLDEALPEVLEEFQNALQKLQFAHEELRQENEALAAARQTAQAMEETLRESEARMRAIVTSAADGIITLNKEGMIVDFNLAAERLFNYTADEVIGQSIGKLMPEPHHRKYRDYLDTYVRTGRRKMIGIRREVTGQRKDGTTFPMDVTVSEACSGNQRLFTGIVRDSTERIKAEEALRQSNAKNQALLNAIPDLIFRIHRDGTFLDFKVARDEELYVPPHQLLGKTVHEVIPPAVAQQTIHFVERALQTDDVEIFEYQLVIKGSKRHYEARLVRYAEDEVLTIVRDITERVQAGERLRESEERFRQLAENIHEVFWLYDPVKKEQIYVSPACEKIWGCSCESLYQRPKSWLDAVHPVDREYVIAAGRKQHQEEYDVEYRLIRPDGAVRWIRDRAFPIRNASGDIYRIAGVSEDITERKLAEEEIRKSEERYRSLVETAGSVIVCLSPDYRILEWNPEAERVYGWKRHEVLGKNYFELFLPEAVRDTVAADINKVLAGEPTRDFENAVLTYNGSERVLLWNSTRLLDAAGQPVGVIGIGQDITARKHAEKRAQLQQQQLIQAEKMASLGILVSGVAHEINNPNNFIMLNAKILSRVWNDVMPILKGYYEENGDFVLAGMPYTQSYKKIGQLISGISEGAVRIQKIVQSLKDFARQDAGDLNQPVDINSVIKSAIVIIQILIKKSTHHFSMELGTSLPLIQGNAQQLEQVLINLITNACHALPDRTKSVVVSTMYDADSSRVIITVCDEGIGIPPEDLEHILEPFFTTKRHIGGTGLGLSVSYNIVKNHGGDLHLTSEIGKGTTATITIPVKAEGGT